MNINDIKSLKRDRDHLKDCVKKFEIYLTDHPDCDKHGLGFNLDSRFRAVESHSVTLDSWKGFYGNSSSSCYLYDIHNSNKFWEFFDEYLNKHKSEILNFISDKFNDSLRENIIVIHEEIKKLNEVIEDINS